MKLVNSGVTIEVDPADAQRYLNAGYVRVNEQPVVRQAVLQKESESQPEIKHEKSKRQKAGKKVTNGNN